MWKYLFLILFLQTANSKKIINRYQINRGISYCLIAFAHVPSVIPITGWRFCENIGGRRTVCWIRFIRGKNRYYWICLQKTRIRFHTRFQIKFPQAEFLPDSQPKRLLIWKYTCHKRKNGGYHRCRLSWQTLCPTEGNQPYRRESYLSSKPYSGRDHRCKWKWGGCDCPLKKLHC